MFPLRAKEQSVEHKNSRSTENCIAFSQQNLGEDAKRLIKCRNLLQVTLCELAHQTDR